jgi:hypothetical protein
MNTISAIICILACILDVPISPDKYVDVCNQKPGHGKISNPGKKLMDYEPVHTPSFGSVQYLAS